MTRPTSPISGKELKEFIEARAGVSFGFSENANTWKSRCPLEENSTKESFLVFNSPMGEFYCTECKRSGDFEEFLSAWNILNPAQRSFDVSSLSEIVGAGNTQAVVQTGSSPVMALQQENMNLRAALARAKGQVEELTSLMNEIKPELPQNEALRAQATKLEDLMLDYQLLRLQLTILAADCERCLANLKSFLG